MNWRGWALVILVLVVFVLAGLGAWTLTQHPPSRLITLSNGTQLRFAGVTYGTNHVMQSRLSAVVGILPGPAEKTVRKWLGNKLGRQQTRSSAKPSMVLWLEPVQTSVGTPGPSVSMQAMLVDEDGVVSGEREHVSMWFGATTPQMSMSEFRVVPRRSRTLECVLFNYHYDRESGKRYEALGRFEFRNPAYSRFPDWTPETLPATKPAGDLDVTLHNFVSGVDSSYRTGRQNGKQLHLYKTVESGREPRAGVFFTVESPRGTNESWKVAEFFLSDVTGNDCKAGSWSSSVGRPAYFSPVLWPDEEAWKLTMWIKRATGIPENDLLVFDDVPLPPVGQSNQLQLTKVVNGVECILESITLRPPMTNSSYSSRDLTIIHLTHADLPTDFAVDLINVSFDDPAAETQSGGSSWGGSHYDAEFTRFPTNQTHVTITYAVQKTRGVEFLVSPNWADSTNTVEIAVEAR